MNRNLGLNIIELMIAMMIMIFVVTMSFHGLSGVFRQLEIKATIRSVTCTLMWARYQAVVQNCSMQVQLVKKSLLVRKKISNQWNTLRMVALGRNVGIQMNAFPVFSPMGTVAPLTRIDIERMNRLYSVTLAITGRLKVKRIR